MKATSSPNPDWKPGATIRSPINGFTSIDPAALDITSCYKLLIGSVIPRPIAFVTTLNTNESVNAAPFSAFNMVTAKPMSVVFSVGIKPNGELKDTLKNIYRTGDFVVNSVGSWMVEAVNYCALDLSYGESELTAAGLTTLPSEVVAPPRVREASIQMECKLLQTVDIGGGAPGSSVLVIGEVVRYHIDSAALEGGRVSAERLQPVARIGGLQYSLIGDVFELSRSR
jgi:flavin reductase (DIM6/NTAB) family NADH-FMN oxidoreductase RutF